MSKAGDLRELCDSYIFACLIDADAGVALYSDYNRASTHKKICDLLELSYLDEQLTEILGNLDKLGVPKKAPDSEEWERISGQYGRKLYDKITQIYPA